MGEESGSCANPSSLSKEEILQHFKVNDREGLTAAEVSRRLRIYGKNRLPEEPKTPFWQLVLDQFDDMMVRMLLMAAMVSYGISVMEGDYWDVIEPSIILCILVLNAIVGVFQENRAEEAIDALKQYIATTAVVLRGGHRVTIDAEDVVPGDIVEMTVGNRIPADVRLLELHSTTFRTDQSILSGESEEVMKISDPICMDTDQRFPINMVYSGTSVVYGRARGVVVHTGSSTEIGSIQRDVQEQEDVKTPLQLKLDEFGVLLSKVIGYICIAVFLVNMFHWYRHFDRKADMPVFQKYGQPIVHSLKVAVALAVAAIPEGLPAVVTTCLALGTRRLSRQNALVRDLGSVETLGRCTVICSDKTGTLTTNMMSVMEVCTAAGPAAAPQALHYYHLQDTQFNVKAGTVSASTTTDANATLLEQDKALNQLAEIAVMCNEASLQYNSESGSTEKVGEATEAALLVMSEKLALVQSSVTASSSDAREPSSPSVLPCIKEVSAFQQRTRAQWSVDATLEFTRCRKSMSVLCSSTRDATQHMLFVKGAPEELLQRSTKVMLANGVVAPLDKAIRSQFESRINDVSGQMALRCLSFAYKNIPDLTALDLTNPATFVAVESDLVFVGACGMQDPPREEILDAMQKCHTAGIRVVMITGDKQETAVAVAQKIGLLGATVPDSAVFTGSEFDRMGLEEKKMAVLSAAVFCRTDPSHKMKLVQLLQDQRLICAMTGDGVNDSPALKKADIGVAMGSGTEVAKSASNMILADDNFATVVNAVREGRCIFNNTKQFIRYLISSNIGEVACVLATGLFGLPEALTPIQLLWVNLVTDGLPATALSFNPPDADIMEQAPRSVDEPIVNSWLFIRYMIIGTYVGLSTVFSFVWWFFAQGYTWHDLTANAATCMNAAGGEGSELCTVLLNPKTARAIALSNLVIVEMFNALNALSENSSIFVTRPSTNKWLIFTILSSIFLHLVIMYVPFFADLFSITPLGVPPDVLASAPAWSIVVPTSFSEWGVILLCSSPVILIDEVLKAITRGSIEKEHRSRKKSQ